MAEDVAKTGAKILFTEKGVDHQVLSQLAQKGILTVKNVSSGDMEKLPKATGGRVGRIPKPARNGAPGQAKPREERRAADDQAGHGRQATTPTTATNSVSR